jgi:hypothetical protein
MLGHPFFYTLALGTYVSTSKESKVSTSRDSLLKTKDLGHFKLFSEVLEKH